MAKKLDLSKMKELLVTKGERVGLAVAASIGGLLLIWGVFSGASASSKDWSEVPKKKAEELAGRLAAGTGEAVPKSDAPPAEWKKERLALVAGNPWWQMTEMAKVRRRVPNVLPPTNADDPKKSPRYATTAGGIVAVSDNREIHTEFLWAGVRSWEADFGNGTFTGIDLKDAKPEIAEFLQPQRMVIVHAVYNYEKQLREFADAMAIKAADLVRKNEPALLPRIIGMDIVRYEKGPSDNAFVPSKEKPYEFARDLYNPDKEFKPPVKMASYLKRFYQLALYDKETTDHTVAFHEHGLMTPIPKFVRGQTTKPWLLFPKTVLSIPAPKKGVGMANQPPPNQQLTKSKGPTKAFPWEENLEKEQLAKLNLEKFDPFDPYGALLGGGGTDPKQRGFQPPPNQLIKGGDPRFAGQDQPKDGDPQNDPLKNMEPKRLIRFIDVDLKPGYTYIYSFQVFLANPYYGRKDVESPEWARHTLLTPSPTAISVTPPITVPNEYFFYAHNQEPPPAEAIDKKGNDTGVGLISITEKGNDRSDIDDQRIAIQIHQWVEKSGGLDPYNIGDWVIAERLLVRRGDPIGRRSEINPKAKDPDTGTTFMAEVPVWDPSVGDFIMPGKWEPDPKDKEKDKEKKRQIFKAAGVAMNFQKSPPMLLVDFEGGKREKRAKAADETSYEMLILGPDGKLFVKNSADDSQDADRVARYQHWRSRLIHMRGLQQSQTNPLDPNRPKGLNPRTGN